MRTISIILAFTLAFSIPSLMRIPRVIPFLQSDVRAEAPEMLDQLRKQGLWIVNTDLRSVERTNDGLCFTWNHRYTSKSGKYDLELLTTCTYE